MKHLLLGAFAISLPLTTAAAQWDQANPATSPGVRAAAAFASDGNGTILMFGGDNGGFSPNGQTWLFDGTDWALQSPIASPGGRAGADMVYDPIGGVYWLYGGLNSSPFGGASKNETWQYDGSTWTQVFPVTTPGGLGLFGMCYDSSRARTVVYGGSANSFFPIASDATWEWNGTDWAQIVTANSPGPLERPAMCFHVGLGKTVLFSGIDPQIGGNDKTWTFDGTNWTEIVVAGAKPSPRTGARMAYDSFRGVCVLTGGQDPMTGTPFADTWEFDGTSWAQIASPLASARLQGMLAFMPTSRRMFYYGGVNFQSFTYYSDTQFYGATVEAFGSGCAGTNGVPSLSASGAPRLGENWTLDVANINTTFNLAVMVFGFTQIPGGVDLGPVLGMPGCFVHVTPDLLLSATAGVGGNASWSWNPITGAVGDTFHVQALCLDPTVNAFGWTISNALAVTLGH